MGKKLFTTRSVTVMTPNSRGIMPPDWVVKSKPIIDHLLALPHDSEDDIAKALLAGGFRGVPNRACECPLAMYLKPILPDDQGIAVGTEDMDLKCKDVDGDYYWVIPFEGELYVFQCFVKAMDAGKYPELVCDPTPELVVDPLAK